MPDLVVEVAAEVLQAASQSRLNVLMVSEVVAEGWMGYMRIGFATDGVSGATFSVDIVEERDKDRLKLKLVERKPDD